MLPSLERKIKTHECQRPRSVLYNKKKIVFIGKIHKGNGESLENGQIRKHILIIMMCSAVFKRHFYRPWKTELTGKIGSNPL